jgi:hypothetical protein
VVQSFGSAAWRRELRKGMKKKEDALLSHQLSPCPCLVPALSPFTALGGGPLAEHRGNALSLGLVPAVPR